MRILCMWAWHQQPDFLHLMHLSLPRFLCLLRTSKLINTCKFWSLKPSFIYSWILRFYTQNYEPKPHCCSQFYTPPNFSVNHGNHKNWVPPLFGTDFNKDEYKKSHSKIRWNWRNFHLLPWSAQAAQGIKFMCRIRPFHESFTETDAIGCEA
jgi:hypothetical protein